MLDRRRFRLASAASLALSGRTAADESPTLATSRGVDTGARIGAKSRLDDASIAAAARRKRLTAAQFGALPLAVLKARIDAYIANGGRA